MDYRILGPVQVWTDAGPADLGTPKQRAMLALLLLHAGEVVSTDRLADLLWDGEPPPRAEVSLRSYAANLRKALTSDRPGALPILTSEHGGYRLAVPAGALDADRFEAMVRSARSKAAHGKADAAIDELGAALDLWTGPALADVADSAFARARAAQLEEQRLGALETQLALELELGDAGRLVPELERLVSSHPLREGLRALLVRALHADGRTAEALASLAQLRERLADELGLDPSPALRDLEAAIRSGTVPVPGAPAAVDEPAPLVGREPELDHLRSIVDEAAVGGGRMVLVAGEPGIGKTRLVEAVAAGATGSTVACARCFAAGDAPAFWPWAQVLRSLAETVDLRAVHDTRTADAANLVPALAERTPEVAPALPPDAARFQRYDAITTLLCRAAAERPITIVLDDLQWADAASLRLLPVLARILPETHLVVLATLRTDELASPVLREVLADLVRIGTVERLELRGLPPAAVTELVLSSLPAGTAPTDPAVEAIVGRAAGNPFFVTELLRLSPDELVAATVPDGVRDVIRQRLDQLPDAVVQVLRIAAVVGVEFDVLTVEAAGGGDATLDAVELAVDLAVVEETEGIGRYRFVHALVQEVLAASLGGLRRARLHATIAGAMPWPVPAAAPGRLAELARHACAGAAADPDTAARAVEVSLEASRQAMEDLGYEAAAAHCERALAAVAAGAEVSAEAEGWLLVALATARRAVGDPAGSRAACLQAAELARRAGDGELLACAALGLALPGAVIGMDFGLVDHARVELLEEALALLPVADTPTRVRLLAHLALALQLGGHEARRQEAADEAVAVAERLGAPGLRAEALAARHSTMWGPTPVADRLSAARDLLTMAEAGGAAQTALEAHIALAIDLLETGEVAAFRAEVALVHEGAARLRQPFYQWYSWVLEAALASMEGRYGDAQQHADEAAEAGGVALGRRAHWGRVGWQYVTAWDVGLLPAIEQPLRGLASTFPGSTLVQAGLAHVLVEEGAPEEAAALVAPLLADPARTVPHDAMWVFTLTLLAEISASLGDVAAARALGEALAPAAGRLVVVGSGVACCGSVDRSLGLLALTAGRLEEAERWLERGLAHNERVGARPWAARTAGTLAVVRRRRHGAAADGTASGLLADARRRAEELGASGLAASLAALELAPAGQPPVPGQRTGQPAG